MQGPLPYDKNKALKSIKQRVSLLSNYGNG